MPQRSEFPHLAGWFWRMIQSIHDFKGFAGAHRASGNGALAAGNRLHNVGSGNNPAMKNYREQPVDVGGGDLSKSARAFVGEANLNLACSGRIKINPGLSDGGTVQQYFR